MTPRELEQLEKKSIYAFRINDDLKDSVVNGYLHEFNRVVKRGVKSKTVAVLVFHVNE